VCVLTCVGRPLRERQARNPRISDRGSSATAVDDPFFVQQQRDIDAADKLRFEALASPELLADDTELGIRIEIDKDKRTLSVTDNGIGMSREELIDNLGTIAKSGTAEFLQQMTGDKKHDAHLIGQFGVGFYSAFIVADKVSVETRRAGLDADAAVRWESEGEGEFTIEDIEREERGTRVVLHLKDDETEFAESFRIDSLIRKYSDHIGFPVSLTELGDDDAETKIVNSATALWTRSSCGRKARIYQSAVYSCCGAI